MTKVTKAERLLANTLVQKDILERLEHEVSTVTDGTKAALRRIYDKLEKESQRIISPKPRTPKPAPSVSPVDLPTGDYVNTKARRGRSGN